MGTSENSPAIHCRDNNSPMSESHKTHDLKKRKTVTMAQVAGSSESDRLQLVAWMDVRNRDKDPT